MNDPNDLIVAEVRTKPVQELFPVFTPPASHPSTLDAFLPVEMAV